MLSTVKIIFAFVHVCLFLLPIVGGEETQQNQADIIFETADIASSYDLENGESVLVQAFKTKRTNQLLNRPIATLSESDIHTLRWMTPGICQFIPDSLSFRPTHAFAKVSCLDNRLQTFLAGKATQQYGVTINSDQILRLVFSRFICKSIVTSTEGNSVSLRGEIRSFQRHPLTMELAVTKDSIGGKTLAMAVAANDTIDFECETFANGNLERKNSLKIDFAASATSEYVEKLFGDGQEKFVTRDQMLAFSEEIYESLNIEEEYEMPELTFSNLFVSEFIRFGCSQGFKPEPIQNALEMLSRYGTDVSHDLSPNTIARDLGSLYTISEHGTTKHVVVNNEVLMELQRKYASTSSGSVSGKAGFLSFSGEAASTSSDSYNSENYINNQNRSLLVELNKLNSKVANQVTFEIEGNRVIPKSLVVAKVVKSKMRRTISLNRVRKEQYSAPYSERLIIRLNDRSTHKHLSGLARQIEQHMEVVQRDIKNAETRHSNAVLQNRNELNEKMNEMTNVINVKSSLFQSHLNDIAHKVTTNGQAISEATQRLENVTASLRSAKVKQMCRRCNTAQNRCDPYVELGELPPLGGGFRAVVENKDECKWVGIEV